MNKFWSSRLSGIEAYVPGEQPIDRRYIKLNTNENPYPPSPAVQAELESLQLAKGEELRLYPDPNSGNLTAVLAQRYQVKPSQVFLGNGSDEVLFFSFMAFMDAQKPAVFPDITYSFYPVYAEYLGIPTICPPLHEDFSIPVTELCRNRGVVVLANPNAPTSLALPLETVERIVRSNPDFTVIVDEAYIDFGGESAVPLVDKYDNLLVIQTFSKSRSLAGLRVGYAIGNEDLITALRTVRDCINSYTIDRVAQRVAAVAVQDEEYFQQTRHKIIATRERCADKLSGMGFAVLPSAANFLFVSHPTARAADLLAGLRQEGILVRYWNKPRIFNHLRITVGTDEEMDALLDALRRLLS